MKEEEKRGTTKKEKKKKLEKESDGVEEKRVKKKGGRESIGEPNKRAEARESGDKQGKEKDLVAIARCGGSSEEVEGSRVRLLGKFFVETYSLWSVPSRVRGSLLDTVAIERTFIKTAKKGSRSPKAYVEFSIPADARREERTEGGVVQTEENTKHEQLD